MALGPLLQKVFKYFLKTKMNAASRHAQNILLACILAAHSWEKKVVADVFAAEEDTELGCLAFHMNA